MGGIQTYGGASKHEGHPNIQGSSKCMGAYGHSLSVTKYAFFVLCMYVGHPNIKGYPNIWECPHIFRGHPNIGMPNIQGSIQTCGASKYTGGCPNMGASKHTEGYPNIWGHPNIQGVHPNKWGHPNILGVSKHKGGHPNIWVVSKHMGSSKHTGGIQTLQQAERCCQQCYTYIRVSPMFGCPLYAWTPPYV